ncbi:hypothetical protein [Vibrio sp.]|uniref:hypothetical protein n=1 Tax=Vibrio sp. TaxID=678 RepID=UPI003D126D8C
MTGFRTALMVAGVLATGSALANERNDIPSCYDYAELGQYKSTQFERELFVVVDRTVRLDLSLKKSVHSQIQHFARPGDKITLVTFSALAEGDYTNVAFRGAFEQPLEGSVRDEVNRLKLRKLDHCLTNQKGAINAVHKRLASLFPATDESYPRTELVGTVLGLSTDLISQSLANRKVVLIVSDMLENSETLSFYRKGKVNVPDAAQAFAKIQAAGFAGDFAGSEVYVIGAGFVEGAKRYSSQKSVNELEAFWQKVVTANNGQLRQFGKPSLMTQIQ